MGKNRLRNNRVVFYLTDDEKLKLENRMDKVGLNNREAFVRKLLLEGFIVQLDTQPTTELVRLIKNATNNINQIAKRANESGSIYENDVHELLAQVNAIVPLVLETHSSVVALSKK